MPSDGSITQWIDQLKEGKEGSVQQNIWNRYFERLLGIARAKLRDAPKRIGDEEDAVVEAMNSFYHRARKGQFPDLRDRTDLWSLLVTITIRKALNLMRYERAKKRPPAGRLAAGSTDDETAQMLTILDAGPTPEIAAMAAEEAERLLKLLPRPELRQTAEWKLQGETNREIAEKEKVIERTIERRLETIREIWSEQGDASVAS